VSVSTRPRSPDQIRSTLLLTARITSGAAAGATKFLLMSLVIAAPR
jgi:hypothetical protein